VNVLEHLVEEHRKVEQMIAKLESSSSAQDRRALLADLGDSLATHMAVEEERVYPIVDAKLGSDKAREAQKEHDTSREDMAAMVSSIESDRFTQALAKFKAGISHHVEEEETEIFPQLQQRAPDEVAALGDAEEVEDDVKKELGAEL
jgi:hemerythrin-like domain-containing protein